MKRTTLSFALLLAVFFIACQPQESNQVQKSTESMQPGEVIPDRRPGEFKGEIAKTYKDSKADFPITRKAKDDAPNVLLIMLDDVGFGAASTFGGPVPTPYLDALAEDGLRYNQWHTTALCSPTRASILTGKNHHEAGFGVISEIATGFPGYNSIMPDNSATIGAILKNNGYNTSWFGKNHNTPDYETSQAGPFKQWPTGMGFEYFFGFNGGDCNQYAPPLIENTRPVLPPTDDPDYHLNKDMANRAISWIRNQKSTAPNKPFFVYFAPGATHAPHHAPKEWRDKFKGKFDEGWNKVSENTFKRMKAEGIIPQNAQYNPIPEEVGVWDELTADQQKVYARMMEVYAAFLAYTDYEIGRMLQAVEDMGQKDNTLVIYAVGDNGASAEGGFTGTLNEIAADFNSYRPDVVKDALNRMDEIGTISTYNLYPVGWAMAMNSPMKFAKRMASHFGGTRNGLVISWPKVIKDKGTIRSQFSHCTDIVPTILEACGIPQPKVVNGVEQTPMVGTSMVYTFDNPDAEETHKTQYFEMGGSRAVYHDGWVAATAHSLTPWSDDRPDDLTFENDVWELYNIREDFTEHNDIAAEHPEKVEELKALFLKEAKAHDVLPLDDRGAERFSAQLTGRPSGPSEGVNHFIYYPGMIRLPEGSAPSFKNRSFTLTADVEISDAGTEGVIITQGGLYAGWGLMMDAGKPKFTYNWLQEDFTTIEGKPLSSGKHTITLNFVYDGGGLGKGANAELLVDGKSMAKDRIPRTVPNRFSLDETLDVGMDTGTPVSEDYSTPFKFTGNIEQVAVDFK